MIAAEAHRQASVTNLNRHRSPSRLMSGSNPSLVSQLAHDVQRHAPFAASSSATSLGRHGQSNLSLHENIPPMPHLRHHVHGQGHGHGHGSLGSAPPSPYGHPAGAAVANGAGDGRPLLPSIGQWGDGDVNPMFRVVSLLTHIQWRCVDILATCSRRWESDDTSPFFGPGSIGGS
jgi:hypothetical protein